MTKAKVNTGIDINDYKGIWIIAEQREGKLQPVSLELLGIGRELADKLHVELTAILLGDNLDVAANELIKYGANRVVFNSHKLLHTYTTDLYTKVIADLIFERKPEAVLIGATTIGRDLAPRLAARVGTGLTADCTKLDIDETDGKILQTRPAFGGNLMATIVCKNNRPQMSTIRPGVMKKLPYDPQRNGWVETLTPTLREEGIKAKVIEIIKERKERVSLTDAEIIISGGRGLGNKEGFELIEKLANKLGGVVGSSRAAVDNGWIHSSHQVGQTGTTVRPKLYIACGISGAIQHLAGMSEAECIVAINKNPDAPIFKIANYSIVGDVYDIIPEIINSLDS
ncbi:electron transfer flavoprotein subunit alpha/FixB family protein [uncultured Clostridium sp.]|uniref:electron transfer flavoprotein subunit alpha/FixB family protein n=1 Tax=uncultured Clostridium sp. TaxID=59620 RepID=UPI0028EEC6F6|nr:electron transfer flavoprotein subunit alpha/FixB family protein [uncultured Clostridium sp.]